VRVLFTPLPWSTHIYQIVGLAWACRLAGDDVRVAVDDALVEVVAAAGLTPAPLGPGFDFMAEARRASQLPRWEGPGDTMTSDQRARPLNRYLTVAETQIDSLAAFAGRWRPDLVVFDPMSLAGPLVAQQLGVPAVRHLCGTDITRLIGWPGMGAATGESGAEWPERLVELYEHNGGKPVDDLAVLTVDPCPTALQVPGHPNRMTICPVPYNGSGWLPTDVLGEPDRPRVLVSWGHTATAAGGDAALGTPAIVEALAGEDVDVVVAAAPQDAAQLRDMPANTTVLTSVPLHTVLPSCAAIVHQGGGGTVMTSGFYGVPQLAVPDQPHHKISATGLPDTGAGLLLPAEQASGQRIRDAVRLLVEDRAIHDAAAGLREEILAQTAPAEVAGRLRELV
jgi:UDP:flavonoid glycosyltransferase YjiC (YdhE family)